MRLGQWVTVQRSFRRRGMMSQGRAKRLEALPGWTWEPYEARWKRGLDALRDYVSEHGVARPAAQLVWKGFRLGGWVGERRTEYKSGRLAKERITLLEAVPGWTWNPHGDKWEDSFRALVEYCEGARGEQTRHR